MCIPKAVDAGSECKNHAVLDGTAWYGATSAKKVVSIGLLFGLLVISAVAGLSVGAAKLGLLDVLSALVGKSDVSSNIVWKLRVPRIVMAVLAGWGLAVGGTVSQAILRNPLASPFTLGVASGAGFGAVMGIVLTGGLSNGIIASSAFCFALVTSFLILAVAHLKSASSETLILAGVAFMYLFSSLTSFMQYVSTMEEVHQIVFWFFGSLSKVGWAEIGIAALMIVPPVPALMKWAWDLNLLMVGDDSAKSLGVNVARLRTGGVILASLMAAGAICFCGVIGFIGLVSPHIARMLIGSDHRFLLPASGILGAVLVLSADTLGRSVWAPQVIPIGIMTSFIGVPFFFYLLVRRKKEYW
ncbi:MAG: iron ABC transporter permease [Deltaproteobacteria bacterium]|nr:iron ABC transporter permease [Deltaproteobacteria bacterium]